jgi:hypothetical protein
MNSLNGYGSGSDSDDDIKPSNLVKPQPSAAPKTKKKIKIGLPTLSTAAEEPEEERPAKRPRLEAGSGSSSLFSMLPAPKQKTPIPQTKRMPSQDRADELDQETSTLSFLPPALAQAKLKASAEPKLTAREEPAADFFSLSALYPH